MANIQNSNIPLYVMDTIAKLKDAGYEAYIVGGCVRDLIIGRTPKDWDVTTNAIPEQIQACFTKTVYENSFGTVAVVIEKGMDDNAKYFEDVSHGPSDNIVSNESFIVEITPYRIESKYSDNRHPDEVRFSDTIEDDLSRRDFTINAMAYDPITMEFIDFYKGQEDLNDMSLRTVGDAKCRFEEDALRMLRAIRFSVELGFVVSHETMMGISECSDLIKNVSQERIRDEFNKIIMSPDPMLGIGLLEKLGLVKHFLPELLEGIRCVQGGAHRYDVYEHLLQALGHAADKQWPLEIRLAALFHDIGKPRTKRQPQGKAKPTFYGHEVVGARMAQKILDRMKYPKNVTELIVKLVRHHMFFSDTEQITLSAVRRIVANVGTENVWTLMKVRECDRVGMAKSEAPARLRKYHAMIEEVLHDPISVKQLKIDGNYMMSELSVKPGRRMGWMLHALLEEVLDDPAKNEIEYLVSRVREMESLGDDGLKELGEKAKQTKDELEEREVEKLHSKHGV